MFDLATVSNLVAAGSALAALLVAGALYSLLRKPQRGRRCSRATTAHHRCSMCQRTTPETATHDWNIRGALQQVCARCHPFYKLRFGSAEPHLQQVPLTPPAAVVHALATDASNSARHEDTAVI